MNLRLLGILLISSPFIHAGEKSICANYDDRVLSNESAIGRASSANRLIGCTATLIGKSCAITAGHCVDAAEKISFNVPESTSAGPQESAEVDIYFRNKDFLRYKDMGEGNDWAVLKILPNKITGLYPGEVQGSYKVESTKHSKKGDLIRITGYGADKDTPEIAFSQQSHISQVLKAGTWFRKALLEHEVDTLGGNSGSPIIDMNSNKIIGVHTHGGCDSSIKANQGTLISKHEIFKGVIQQCLQWERDTL